MIKKVEIKVEDIRVRDWIVLSDDKERARYAGYITEINSPKIFGIWVSTLRSTKSLEQVVKDLKLKVSIEAGSINFNPQYYDTSKKEMVIKCYKLDIKINPIYSIKNRIRVGVK